MVEVIMPKMGDGMDEGQLVEWLKKEGDRVDEGDVIGSIQTDKATLDLEAPGSGVLAGVLIREGQSVPVGTPIAALLSEGDALPADWGQPREARASVPAATAADATPRAEAPTPPVAAEGVRVKASPLARRIAQDAGIDIATVAGSGPGGRIVERDVREAVANSGTRVAAAPVERIAETAVDVKAPLNRLRAITAERTQQAKQQAPHFYVTVEVDLERIATLRRQFAEEESGKVSINDFVVKASAKALQEMPEVNATFRGDHVLRYGAVHVGIAASVEEGLLVPVIRNAHRMTLRQLAARSRELVNLARAGKLAPDDMQGSTFSISNMGMLNVDNFVAIINVPNAAIVAVSSARKRAVVAEDGQIVVRTRMNITGSFDHRVVDGATGARFMNVVRDYLEHPTRLID